MLPKKIRSKAQGPKSSNQFSFEVSKDITFEVRKRGLSKNWLEVRLLLSKLVHEPSKFNQEDYFVLDGLTESLLSCKDYSWNKLNRKILILVSNSYGLIRNHLTGNFHLEIAIKNSLEFAGLKLLSACAYFGMVKHHSIRSWLVRRNRALTRNPPPQRFVGVGYRDQGTCSNPAVDGNHSWQQVASASKNEERNWDSSPWAYIYSNFLKCRVPLYPR